MQGSHTIESNTSDNHTTISKRPTKIITTQIQITRKPLMKLKPQITLITLTSHATDNETGDKITITSSCQHTLNKHKANKPCNHSGANNRKHTTLRNQITLKSLVTLTTLK